MAELLELEVDFDEHAEVGLEEGLDAGYIWVPPDDLLTAKMALGQEESGFPDGLHDLKVELDVVVDVSGDAVGVARFQIADQHLVVLDQLDDTQYQQHLAVLR